MRVLVCIWRMSVGGAERQLVQLAASLVRRNVDVHVATAERGALDDALHSTGATLHRIPRVARYDPLVVPRLASLMRRLRPDVVNTWLLTMDIVGGAAAALARAPWLLSERSSGAAYFPSFLHEVRRRMGAHSRLIVANSEGGRDYWRPFVGDDHSIEVIPNILPRSDIVAARPVTGEVPEGAEVILFAGGFRAEKNVVRLVEALAPILKRRDAIAVFCGDGPLRGALEARARELGVAERIVFKGVVGDVWPWMKRASVVVSPSLWEGDPNSVLEAMACGTPLVVSDIEAHRTLLDETTAAMVDAQSAESIAAGVAGALANPEEACARAARARAMLDGRAAEQIAARYEEAYRKAGSRASLVRTP